MLDVRSPARFLPAAVLLLTAAFVADLPGDHAHARADTRARQGQELGARYMLAGELQAIEDVDGRERVVFYQVDASLIDLETNTKVWVGQHKIKKYITRSAFGL